MSQKPHELTQGLGDPIFLPCLKFDYDTDSGRKDVCVLFCWKSSSLDQAWLHGVHFGLHES